MLASGLHLAGWSGYAIPTLFESASQRLYVGASRASRRQSGRATIPISTGPMFQSVRRFAADSPACRHRRSLWRRTSKWPPVTLPRYPARRPQAAGSRRSRTPSLRSSSKVPATVVVVALCVTPMRMAAIQKPDTSPVGSSASRTNPIDQPRLLDARRRQQVLRARNVQRVVRRQAARENPAPPTNFLPFPRGIESAAVSTPGRSAAVTNRRWNGLKSWSWPNWCING